ncbi:AAA family ATPase [Sphingobacterium litopenaei]|uniref:ATP-binding protein n=1 Tax=Sphingobacterium litopenaei TaxID=2763500 RepID=A0ABR7YHA4_9SPHI|nr:AAA family ATPase [Sphingobacterium litopenaei]MBD1430705.1 ATP-binding protein [Sphingobacterium litopenaei]
MSAKHNGFDNVMGNPMFHTGFNKDQFEHYGLSSKKLGYGFDAFILLEERYDLRIQIEATLSQLLNGDIKMEWDSGRLNPVAYNKISEKSYKLHKDECHGIKELLILLTHLYNDENESLIIDEPELNLHPQYQSFLINEIKKVLHNPRFRKKNIVLITH